jgi:hypothetical protein
MMLIRANACVDFTEDHDAAKEVEIGEEKGS